MLKYRIEELKLDNLEETLKVVEITFMKFVAPDYTEEGIRNFLKFISYDSIKENLSRNMKMYIAKIDEKIVGVIGYRDNSHINLLFVPDKYHYNGISKSLYNLVVENCKKIGTERITVNSSPYAHDIYLKFGFIDDNKMQEVDGIKFYPMHKDI